RVRRAVVVERAAQIAHALAADLAAVFADDDRRPDLVGARLVDGREVRLAAGRARAPNALEPRHSDALETEERELDERVPRQLLQATEHGAARARGVPLARRDDLRLEAREVRSERPIRRRDALPAGEAEARAHPARDAAQVVGPERGGELRLRGRRIARE